MLDVQKVYHETLKHTRLKKDAHLTTFYYYRTITGGCRIVPPESTHIPQQRSSGCSTCSDRCERSLEGVLQNDLSHLYRRLYLWHMSHTWQQDKFRVCNAAAQIMGTDQWEQVVSLSPDDRRWNMYICQD